MSFSLTVSIQLSAFRKTGYRQEARGYRPIAYRPLPIASVVFAYFADGYLLIAEGLPLSLGGNIAMGQELKRILLKREAILVE